MIDLAAHLPELDGRLEVPGLAAPVRCCGMSGGCRNPGGEADAWFALGFVHAQDRLFQMELTRRRATGRAAEFLGPAAFEQDALSRRLGVERASRRDYDAAAAETRAMLDRYAAGVNALIDSARRCRSSTRCWTPRRSAGRPGTASPSCGGSGC